MVSFDSSDCGIFCYKEISLQFKRRLDKYLEARAQGG